MVHKTGEFLMHLHCVIGVGSIHLVSSWINSLYICFNCSCSVWVARRPPGYAFIDFDDRRDAQDAIREIDGELLMFSIGYLITVEHHYIKLLFWCV